MNNTTPLPVHEVQLGDLVTLPDGRSLSVRSRVPLSAPVGNMAGFLIVGELEVLLSTPTYAGADYGVYVPVSTIPEPPARLRVAFSGVTRYWAPHLPALADAMAEMKYEVLDVRGQIDPLVVVHRGPEMVVFIKSTYANPTHVLFTAMPRGVDNTHQVTRRTATVVPAGVPAHDPTTPAQPARRTVRRRLTGTR